MDKVLPRELVGQLTLVFGAVFLTTYLLYRRHKATETGRKLPPSLPSLPIIGSLPFMPAKMEELADFCISPKNKLGKVFSFRAGSKYMVTISGRDAIHEALVLRSSDFADRPQLHLGLLINPNNKGIASSPYNAAFKTHHQLCLSILKRFGFGQRVMETRILMEVEEMIHRLRVQQGRPFNVKRLTTSCVANVIMNMLFGRRFDHEDAEFQRLISGVDEMLAEFMFIVEILPPLRWLPYFKKQIADLATACEAVSNIVSANISACQSDEEKKASESFVGYYIESQGPEYDREQLLVTVRDLLSAGMETTATTIRWAIVLLTNHVAVQERLHKEIDSVIGRNRLPTLDDRARMPYMEATILEVMRYKTLVQFVPHAALQDTEVAGYFVPQGTMVMVNLHSAHMDPADWHQPQQFRPERFLDESDNIIDKERVIPFALGKRSCLGEQLARQEIFLFLVALLQNFDFRPPEGQERIDVEETFGHVNAPSAYEVRMVDRKQI